MQHLKARPNVVLHTAMTLTWDTVPHRPRFSLSVCSRGPCQAGCVRMLLPGLSSGARRFPLETGVVVDLLVAAVGALRKAWRGGWWCPVAFIAYCLPPGCPQGFGWWVVGTCILIAFVLLLQVRSRPVHQAGQPAPAALCELNYFKYSSQVKLWIPGGSRTIQSASCSVPRYPLPPPRLPSALFVSPVP